MNEADLVCESVIGEVIGGDARNQAQQPYVFDAAMSPHLGNGNVMVVGLGDGTVRLLDLRQSPANEILNTSPHVKWTTCVDISARGDMVAAVYGSGVLAVWDVRRGGQQWEVRTSAQVHEQAAFGCCFWPGESELVLTW